MLLHGLGEDSIPAQDDVQSDLGEISSEISRLSHRSLAAPAMPIQKRPRGRPRKHPAAMGQDGSISCASLERVSTA